MKEYTLYLDESGDFEEVAKRPSMVAGYLIEGINFDDNKARTILEKVKNKNELFEQINIKNFHGMEDRSVNLLELCVCAFEEMAKISGLCFVSFINKKNFKVVNNDITYLNVLTDGIIQLLQNLVIKNNNEAVMLNINYARRKDVTISNRFHIYTPIENYRYKNRIDEYLFWRLEKLDASDREKFNYSLTMGDAKIAPTLMLADLVCNCLRGKVTVLKSEQKQRINVVSANSKLLQFKSQQNTIWKDIKNSLCKNDISEAICDWYIYLNDSTEEIKKEFHDLLLTTINRLDSKILEIQYIIIGQRIRTLIDNRKFIIAEQFCQNIINDLFKVLKKDDEISKAFYFDICFYCLTIATHQGDTFKEIHYVDECNKALADMKITFENINYYLRYKLRIAEHYKNIFEFDKAIKLLKKLEVIQNDSLALFECIDSLEGIPKKLHSDNLGKIYGSMISAIFYKIDITQDDFIQAIDYSQKAVNEFTKSSDLQRHYQIRCQLEYTFNKTEEAYNYLSKSLGFEDCAKPNVLLQKILEVKHNDFYLMHYVNLMDKRITNSNNSNDEMYEAWNSLKAEDVLRKKINSNKGIVYPYYIVLWKIGHIKFVLEQKNAKEYYIEAYSAALKNENNYTTYFAGLAILAEQAALFMVDNNISKDMRKLKNLLEKFREKEVPLAMKNIIEECETYLEKCSLVGQCEKKKQLLKFKNLVPIL